MLTIDGSEGGGQLLRTALSLSALTGRPFRMTDVRGSRETPGLRPQHLAAVRAVAEITGAATSEADVGSETVEFRPSGLRSGRFEVDVGTAGSVPLVFDAVLPLATALEAPLVLTARGGTDVRWAPTLEYYCRVKLPLLRRLGVVAVVDTARRGFYPAGGGEATLTLGPSTIERIEWTDEPEQVTAGAYSIASADLADREVAERQAAAAVEKLDDLGLPVSDRSVAYTDAASPGSAVTVRLAHGSILAGTDAVGERGKPAETVAAEAVGDVRAWLDSGAAVDCHLADQLLVFLGLAGGRVSVPAITDHVRTNRTVLSTFGVDVRIDSTETTPVVLA